VVERSMDPARVAMVVASNIVTDTRVQKSAASVARLGHDVTVFWPKPSAAKATTTGLGRAKPMPVPAVYNKSRERAMRLKARRTFRIARRKKALRRVRSHRITAWMVRHTRVAWRWLPTQARRSIRGGILGARRRITRAVWHVGKAGATTSNHLIEQFWVRRDDYLARRKRPVFWSSELSLAADLETLFLERIVAQRPDIIHAHDIHVLAAAAKAKAILHRKGYATRLIYDAHEFVAGTGGARAAARAAWAHLERRHIRHVDEVITVSEPIAQELRRRYRLRRPPTVVMNAPDTSKSRRPSLSLRAQCGLGPDEPLLLYSGGVSPQRGVIEIVRAMPLLPWAHLVIVAVPNVASPHLAAIRSAATQLGVQHRVHFVNPVPRPQIIPYIAEADIGIHPLLKGPANHEMALPNKLFEYIHAGLPVVVSDVKLMSRFVTTEGIGEVYTSLDFEDLARAINAVQANLDDFRFATARPELRAAYSWQHQARGIAAVYERLAPRTNPTVRPSAA